MKIVVTGHGGQLSSEFFYIKSYNKNWKFISENDLDISDRYATLEYFKKKKIDLIINCAAYTAVDKAEENIDLAYNVNYLGVKNLLEACKFNDSKIIHFSTDYVFDGESIIPYNENDLTNPTSIYGKSKLKGEIEIQESDVKSIIVRTSWVYSCYGNNFVKTMLKLSKSNDEISVISDQIGSPTYAEELAKAILIILKNKKYKWISGDIFNFSNNGKCSWYDFAKEIFFIQQIPIKINKIKSKDYITLARRPKYSLLNKNKFEKIFNFKINSWEIALKNMLKKLNT